jgi:hypothetical protein
MKKVLFLPLAVGIVTFLSLSSCELPNPLPEGSSEFTIDGRASFSGYTLGKIKMAYFYTGSLLYRLDCAEWPDDDASLVMVSNVVDLGRADETPVEFTLSIDVRAYSIDGDTVMPIMWERFG